MKPIPKFYLQIFLAGGFLLAGVANYLLLRPGIILLSWLHIVPARTFVLKNVYLLIFLRGYFSDIMWCIALCLTIMAVDTLADLGTMGIFILLSLPFLSEIGQYFSMIPGTFDWFDILAYSLVIFFMNIFFQFKLIPIPMRKIKLFIIVAGVFLGFFIMVLACAPPRHTYKPAPDPCVNHAALTYSPVLVQINIDGSYTMKDLAGAQISGQNYFFQALQNLNYGKYSLAQGVTPNLNIYITVNTDGYQHYGATVKLYVYDDNTWFSMPSNYVDPEKLFDDIASKLNSFVMYGWKHGNCGTS
jgi:hypothetical protein